MQKWGIVVVVACLLVAGREHVSAVAPGDLTNAATWYNRAIEKMERLTSDQRTILLEYDPHHDGPPSPELRAALDKVQPLLNDLRRGSLQQFADNHLAYEMHIHMPLPHLAAQREISRIARTDAMVRMEMGDARGAAERLAAMYRMAGHHGDDQLVISSLVGQAIFAVADSAVQHGIDHAAFDVAEHATLLSALDMIAERQDPFRMISGIATEQDMVVHWVEQMRDLREHDPDAVLEEVHMLMGVEELPVNVLEMTDERIDGYVDAYETFTDRMIDAFMIDDPDEARAAVQAIEAEMLESEDNLLAQLFAPAYSILIDRSIQAREMLDARRVELRELVDGEVEPRAVANAAVWYLRGIGVLHDLEPDYLESLRSYSFDPDDPLDDDIKAALLSSQHIITIFREGSEKRRCDFSIVHCASHLFMPSYAIGMRDAFRLLRADAARHLEHGEYDIFTDRCEIMLRMMAHLGRDQQILSGLIAHRALFDAAELIEVATEDDLLTSDQRIRLANALNRIHRSDPFGYTRALRSWRESATQHIERDRRRAEREAESDADGVQETDGVVEPLSHEQAKRRIGRANDDMLFMLLAADESVREARTARIEAERAGTSTVPPSRVDDADEPMRGTNDDDDDDEAESDGNNPLKTLRDVFDLEAVDDVQQQALAITLDVEGERLRYLLMINRVELSELAAWRAAARHDVRRLADLLIPEAMRSLLLRDEYE